MELCVSDVKQWFYCPRIVYYRYCLPLPRPLTDKMVLGAAEHEVLSVLERRRSLRKYGLAQGQRFFHVPLASAALGLAGVLDLLIITADGGYFVVEFKHTTQRLARNHKLQLTAYCLLVEETYGPAVRGAFLYRIPYRDVTEVAITPALRAEVRAALAAMREMILAERMPLPTPQRGKCVDCEYRRFCGDVG